VKVILSKIVAPYGMNADLGRIYSWGQKWKFDFKPDLIYLI